MMKRALQLLLAISFATMFLISPVAAATSQGLEWNIEVSDQWNFDFTSVTDGVTAMDEVLYFESTGGLTTIPNILTDWVSLPEPSFDVEWANGTSLGFSAFIFIFYMVAVDRWAVPIGNYTLLGELYEDHVFYNGTIYETSSYWGMDVDYLGQLDVHVDFLKDDGFLAHWTVTTENGTLSMIRQGLPSDIIGLITDNILYIGVGVGVLILLAVVCKKK
ncbi:MAG: hypothetical protein KAJ36_00185 [Candidatus Thorarchaeota archaeon]|nr:hypothetical protein [Candidatus Thorarchaeota archaeon]MCK5388878.1 hypothetical protein [Candidatus Thorarchaeota archaeon]